MNFMTLSDEVIALIFMYTSSRDKCSLALTCSRFNHILCERKLTRNVDLKCCFLPFSAIKHFFNLKLRCENILTLDLSSCYWLTSTEIFTCVLKMKQLNSLYVVDTKLSFCHLKRLFEELNKLENISFSWLSDAKLEDFNFSANSVKRLNSLKFLYIYLPNPRYSFNHINLLLQYCNVLEELWILSHFVPSSSIDCIQTTLLPQMKFEHLHTLVVNVDNHRNYTSEQYLYRKVLYSVKSWKSWKCFWISNTASILQELSRFSSQSNIEALQCNSHLAFPKNIYCLKYLYINNHDASELNAQLMHSEVTHLYMSSSQFQTDFPLSLKTLVLMHCSCNNKNILKSIVTMDSLEELSCKLCVFLGDDNNKLQNNVQILVNHCQHLKILSIQGCSEIEHSKLNMSHLDSISCLIHLKELNVSDMPMVRNGKFLVKITSNCQKLERLSIKNVGSQAHCVYLNDLAIALRNCNQLKDFRFEHTNMGQTVNLFKSLELCKSLERIVLIAGYHTIAFQRAWIQRLFENNFNLILFIAQIPSITKENAKATEKSIKMRFQTERPALIIKIVKEAGDWEYKLPVVHFVGILSSKKSFIPYENKVHISHLH